MTPYKTVLNQKWGLTTSSLPGDVIDTVDDEDNLENFILPSERGEKKRWLRKSQGSRARNMHKLSTTKKS